MHLNHFTEIKIKLMTTKHFCQKGSNFYGVCLHIIFDKINNQRKNLPMSLEPLVLTVEDKFFMVKPFIGYFCIKYENSLKKIFMNPLHITLQRLSGVQIHTPIYYIDELFEIIDELHISHPFFTSKVKGKVFIHSNSVQFKDLREISDNNEIIYESSPINNEGKTVESKFKLVFTDKLISEVSDLSLNYKMYFPDNHKLIYPISYEATDFMFQLDEFISSNNLYTNYFLFCGNKGIGKTTNLLWTLRNIPQCKSLYLDLKILNSYKYTKEEKIEMIKNEFIYLFQEDEIDQYKQFCINLLDNELMHKPLDFIINILEYFQINKKNVVVVLDHFDSDINNRILSTLIRYSSQQMKIIISANINNTIKDHLLSQFESFSKKKNYRLYYYPKLNSPLTEVSSTELFNGIPKCYFSKTDHIQYKEKIRNNFIRINDEEDYIITFESLYSLVINIDKEISIETLKTIIKGYPLKYFVISQISQCVFKLNYSFPLVRLGLFYALDISFQKIKEKKHFVESSIMRDHLYKGLLLEYSIHHFMKEGSIFDKLLITGIIYVDTIAKFNLLPQKIPKNKKVLYFKQNDFFGPKYDSAIVFNKNGINKLILFQITRFKNINKIVSKEEAKEDCQSIISILSKSLDIKITINNCYLYFIFASESPDKTAITYCQNRSIGTLLFSIKEENFTTTTFSEDLKLGENNIYSVTANPPKWNNEIQSFLQKKTNRGNKRKSNKKENKIKGDDMKKLISEVGKGNFDSSSVQDFVLIYQKQKKGILVKDTTKYKIQYNAEIQGIN